MTHDILIVGAGPTGLTAAVELARRGIIATVIERRETVSGLSRAVGIIPASMRILAPSGVADALAAEAVPIACARVHAGARRIAQVRLDRDPDPARRFFCLPQDRTEAHLHDAFTRLGGAVRYGAALEALTEHDGHVEVRINGASERYARVIGADGVHSPTRRALGLAYRGLDLPGEWSIADVDVRDWPGARAVHAYLLRERGAVIVVPIAPERVRVVASSGDALAALPVAMDIRDVRRTGAFTVSVRQVERYATARVFLAGDAAHCHSPVGGRGMNLGIADAADLARRFAEGGLDSYHAARHMAGAQVIAASETARKLAMERGGAGRALMLSAVWLAGMVPALERRAVRTILGD